ncbi:MAG: substrate-binding domain-containing protein [Methylobacteriaceae bacterium]|nr:substrate-binding domain-containing protein [Methylobacteriaceae bacterium]
MARKTGKAATISDVAMKSGVSVGTVSRTLNAPDTVRPATLRRVRAIIDELGFQPDARAQNMRRRRTSTVGFIVDDISNPLHAITFKAAEAELREHGYWLHLVNTEGKARQEADAIERLQHGRVDGLIMTINNEKDGQCRDRLAALRVPSVLLDREVELAIDAVLTDHAPGLFQATDYLLEIGHRRIALITAGPEIRPGRERVKGFVEAFGRRKLACPHELIRSQRLSPDFGFHEASSLMQGPDRPTAIIAGGNRILVGVLKAIQQQRIVIPDELSLVTCDSTDLTRLYPGPLTVVDRDIEDIGRTAAQLLLERLGDRHNAPARRILVSTRLILGGSCAPSPPG